MNQHSLLAAESEEGKAARRAARLRTEIEYHNRLYHTLDAPEITDEAYDSLFRELVAIEQRYPRL